MVQKYNKYKTVSTFYDVQSKHKALSQITKKASKYDQEIP